MNANPAAPLLAAVRTLALGGALSADDAAAAFATIMEGNGTAAQTAALLMGLRVKGETADEVAGAARAMRGAMTTIAAPSPSSLVDTCGTGGGAVTTFNISTAAALLAAGAGVRVAKHGNRSFTSKCGSADVLEALGVAIDLPVEKMAAVLERAGIVFMFAPTMHPAMRHVGPVRREIAIPTVMNLIGPLANPAHAGRQVIGVADAGRLELMAKALCTLGTAHALVVHGEPGMDEISPLGPTRVIEIRGPTMTEWVLDPAEYGFNGIEAAALAGGDPAENAASIEGVLQGRGNRGAEAAVLLNAAGAIYVAGLAGHFASALTVARHALAGGAGWDALQRLRSAAPRS